MQIDLDATVEGDGRVALRWRSRPDPERSCLLLHRTGHVPSFTSLALAGETTHFRLDNLSRHQRYRIALLGLTRDRRALSSWIEVTPRAGLEPRVEGPGDLSGHVAPVERIMVMPQDRRLTVWWKLGRGFVDRVVLELDRNGDPWRRYELEPEVRSLSLDRSRDARLQNGTTLGIRVTSWFAGVEYGRSPRVSATPAPAGRERDANRSHAQDHLLYPTLAVSPEVRIFPDDEGPAGEEPRSLICCHCRREVLWRDHQLACIGCGAGFIPNGRGDYLELARLRFGTCQCCLPRKILIRGPGPDALRCSHSGKEHIRMPAVPGQARTPGGFLLIEDLPHGLCQCCRPRRPLLESGQGVACSRSREVHRLENGVRVLVPREPVFDAAAIDDLLDAGLAEICATGVTRGTAQAGRRVS